MQPIIETLKNLNLGLARDGRVELKSQHDDWNKAFAMESARLHQVLPRSQFTLHHMGSTSIPNIFAKPILDILIEVQSIEAMDQYKTQIENLAYEYKGEYGIPGRRYCVLYNADKSMSYVHVHAFAAHSAELEKHLIFRDYLRAHPARAAAYSNLKTELLKSSSITRSQYGDAKHSLVKQVLGEAKAWKVKAQ